MVAKEALERDWSSLLPDVLVARNLNEICDFVHFRAVCKVWRSSTPVTELPPQFPWIIEEHINPYYESDSEIIRFYSMHFDKIYTIHSSKLLGKSKALHRQSDGYVLAKCFPNPCFLSLLNLLNNHEMPLPAYNFGGWTEWIQPWKNQMGVHAVCDGSGGCLRPILISCYSGQDNWCTLKLGSDYEHCKLFFLNGMIFSIETHTGVTKVEDITTGTLAYVIPPIEGYLKYRAGYIVNASGHILRVIQQNDQFSNPYEQFNVYRLKINKSGSGCWVKVKNVGDQALFIDIYECMVLRANDFAGIKRNCIYFLTCINQAQGAPFSRVARIDIETDVREHFPCPLRAERWFVPSLKRHSAE
ncbi:F-box domain-containing protein [Rhynchospora pubera]|uniref:F-box domain-containing protein n=1 Tax=Rhynchospora pubera TaxID=906938 RepID=A0AAV8F897_9POAL|nr:F-box domain-containing protein [Rhynchospora pubera]